MHFSRVAEGLVEPERTLPISSETEVLVAGGGPAGVAAAIAAARHGARTRLIEHYGCLGGAWTAGLITPLFESSGKGEIVDEIVSRLQALGAWGGLWNIAFDPEAMKQVLEQMAREAGVELLYYTWISDTLVEDGNVRGVVIENKSGRSAALGAITIDCTGDGDVAARAGVPFHLGRERDGLMQPMTLMFRLEGVEFSQAEADELYNLLMEAAPEATAALPYNRPWIIRIPRPGAGIVQMTHMHNTDGTNAADLTRAMLEGREQVQRAMDLFARRSDRLGKVRLVDTALQIGVRESRRIVGDYTLTLEDLASGRRFPDDVVSARFGVDIHSPDSQEQEGIGFQQPYWVPYRCLLPQGVENLLVAGRCISGTHEAHAAYRVTGTCAGIGHAAGVAAALALQAGCTPRALDVQRLRQALHQEGVPGMDVRL